ncbi:MAG: hypothetical protein A2061_06495 [Gallionellales bacterium GWA2_59_43]|nr:MAG: hypothetical protein A2061_06495 [Gallionellales bacterium GWA2_59_43]
MAKSRYKNAADKRDSGGHVAIPFSVLNGAAYLGLSAHARMLLFDLAAQYRGNNNGDLCAAFKSLMRARGWKSEETLNNAKRSLLEAGLIFETRKGGFPNKCALFALTWYALDDCGGKLDITAQSFPRSAYRLKDPRPVIAPRMLKNASLTTAGVVEHTR